MPSDLAEAIRLLAEKVDGLRDDIASLRTALSDRLTKIETLCPLAAKDREDLKVRVRSLEDTRTKGAGMALIAGLVASGVTALGGLVLSAMGLLGGK